MTGNGGTGGTVGGKVAQRISRIVADAHLATKSGSADVNRRIANMVWRDFFAGTGQELRNTMGATFKALAEHPDTHDSLRPLFAFLTRGQGEMATFLGGSITGSVISGGLGDLLNNLLAPVVHDIIGKEPFGELAVSDIAAAKARGIAIGRDHDDEAHRAGYNTDRFNALVQLNYRRPDVGQILDAVNRGDITEEGGRGALLQLGFREGDLDTVMALRRVLLTPAALADMVVRGIMTRDDAAAIAVQNGLSTKDFDRLVLDTGEPPGTQDLLFAHRRGFIDLSTVERGIRQSRVRDEWIPTILSLSTVPMTTADAIEAAVQGHITLDESRTIAAQNGLMPEHWQPLYDTAGNPPGVQEMVSMWHRGVLTLDELVQGIKESRLKDKYIQRVIDAAETLLPERSVVSLVSKNAITPAAGMDILLRRGYSKDIATALISEAHTTKTAATRSLTATQVVALYEDRAIDLPTTQGMLASLRYDDSEVGWLITLADLRRIKKFNDAAISRVHTQYVAHKIDSTRATTTLDALGISPDQRNDLLALWDIERTVSTKQLTLAQIEAAFKKQVISPAVAFQRLQEIGYAVDDAAIIMETLGAAPVDFGQGQV